MMDLILEFRDGIVTGEGSDGIGRFGIDGSYTESTMECSWIKTYIGKHSVSYTGYREGKGIWGTWSILQSRGGFQIWPIGSQPLANSLEEEESAERLDKIVQPAM
jgi:hypothetical protein